MSYTNPTMNNDQLPISDAINTILINYCSALKEIERLKKDAECNQISSNTADSAPKTLVSEETFRSSGSGVDKTDDMVRVTIDMPRTVWWEWKRIMFRPNAKSTARRQSTPNQRKAMNDQNEIESIESSNNYNPKQGKQKQTS